MDVRALRGQNAYHAGLSAEQRVARDYEARGFSVDRRRWRGAGGEIDLIARDSSGFVFVEVKQSRSFAQAAERLGRRQMERIYASAEQFMAENADARHCNARFDVALVDRAGALEIIENAFGQA